MGVSKRICPNCGRNMTQQFVGLKHCKCGVSWMKHTGYFERTTDMKFCLERRKAGNKVKQCPVIQFDPNKPSVPVGKPGKKLSDEGNELQDDNFFFIAGYTSGGAPYGIAWDEVETEADNEEELPF